MAPNLTPTDVKQGKGDEGLMVAPLGIPLIDISELDGPKHDQVVESIVKAAQTSGFFQVVNHGLSVEFLDEMRDSIHRFHNQPEENKAVYLREVSPSPLVTFFPNGMPEMARRSDGLLMTYTNEQDVLKYWPDSYKEVALKYLKTSKKMGERILQVLMSNLGVTLDEATVDAWMGDIDLNLTYYPSCPNGVTADATPKHMDAGTMTVLLQDDVGGLFCKLQDDGEEGEWVEIKSTPGALLILLGDCFEVLSNGKYKGGEHFVQRLGDSETRVSSTIFMKPKSETRIGPLPQVVERDGGRPRYKEFLYGEYLEYAYQIVYSSDYRCPIDSVRISSNA